MGMFDGTSFPAVYFLSAETPLTRRLLVYFRSGAYTQYEKFLFVQSWQFLVAADRRRSGTDRYDPRGL
jgi:hypothetical protein